MNIIRRSVKWIFNRGLMLINRSSVLVMRQPVVISIDETINTIKNRRASIGRLGDGEFRIICGGKIGFQDYDAALAERLKEVLKKNDESERFLVGLPDCFGDMKEHNEVPRSHWQARLDKKRIQWVQCLNTKAPYYNSQFTRFYFDWTDKSKCAEWFARIQSFWDNMDVLVVEGELSRVGVGNNMFENARSVRRVLCPSVNAFNQYDKIMEIVSSIANKGDFIFIALGPTATILAYDLYRMGYWAVDCGHLDIEYEWMMQGVSEKIAIPGKYVNEVRDGKEVCFVDDSKYLDEIVARI